MKLIVCLDCKDELGMTNGDIPDENIQASSELTNWKAWNARIGGLSKWATRSVGEEEWIQADIGYTTFVSGIVTQGDAGVGGADWVTSLKVSTFANITDADEMFITDENGSVMVSVTDALDVKSFIQKFKTKKKCNYSS